MGFPAFCKWNEWASENIEWLAWFFFIFEPLDCDALHFHQYYIHMHGTLSFLFFFMFQKAEPRRGKAYRWKFQRISKTITKNKYGTRRRWCFFFLLHFPPFDNNLLHECVCVCLCVAFSKYVSYQCARTFILSVKCQF